MNIKEFLFIIKHRILSISEITYLIISFFSASFLLLLLDNRFKIFDLFKKFEQYSSLSLNVLKIALWIIMLFFVRWFAVKVKELSKRGNTYIFESGSWCRDWIFNGRSYMDSPDRIIVLSSRAGCLLNKHIWKNFEMKFEMKFLKEVSQKQVGIIFRARDLENYFMLEIIQKDGLEHCVFIKPHIRSQGAWELTQEHYLGCFDLTDFQAVKVIVRNEDANLYIEDKQVFEWNLPTHVDINHIEAGVQGASDETTSRGIIPKIDFRKQYGMIGFRAHPGQGAEIKRLRIKSIDC